jgi:hypothetical protein
MPETKELTRCRYCGHIEHRGLCGHRIGCMGTRCGCLHVEKRSGYSTFDETPEIPEDKRVAKILRDELGKKP